MGLFGKNGRISLNILIALIISAWLMNLLVYKREAGALLFAAGRTERDKLAFWVGLLQIANAVFQTWLFLVLATHGGFDHTIAELDTTLLEVGFSRLWSPWFWSIYFITFSLSRLELMENGLCYKHAFLQWHRINSYSWGPAKPNVLTIRFKPRYPLIPGLMSIEVSRKQKDSISQVLDERLPGKQLASVNAAEV